MTFSFTFLTNSWCQFVKEKSQNILSGALFFRVQPSDGLDDHVLLAWPSLLGSANIAGGRRYTALQPCTLQTSGSSVHICQKGCVGTLLHSLSIGSHPPTTHTQPQQDNLLQFHLSNPLSPEMMTHSFGPHVCTFPMALPARASLKREKPFATSEEKTASPVGPSVTVSRFGLAMEECGLTSQTDSTDSNRSRLRRLRQPEACNRLGVSSTFFTTLTSKRLITE